MSLCWTVSPSQSRQHRRMSSSWRVTMFKTSRNQVRPQHSRSLSCKVSSLGIQLRRSRVSAGYGTRISVNSWMVSTCPTRPPSSRSDRFTFIFPAWGYRLYLTQNLACRMFSYRYVPCNMLDHVPLSLSWIINTATLRVRGQK